MAEGVMVEAEIEGMGRPLGPTENMFTHLSETYASVIYWHEMFIKTTQSIQDKDFIAACRVLVRKQEMLQMRIVQEGPERKARHKYVLQPMEDLHKVDFESVAVNSKAEWSSYICNDHNTRNFDYVNGPLWRFILGHIEAAHLKDEFPFGYMILIKLPHCIVDGISVFDMLYRQYLPILSAVINGRDAENVIPFIPLSKSVEELLLPSTRPNSPVPLYIRLQLGAYRWKNRTFKLSEIPCFRFSDDIMPFSDECCREQCCIPKIFGEDICSLVIEKAKQHDVTVHCVLLSAGATALCRTAKTAGIKLPPYFKQQWPIDLRRRLVNYQSPQPLAFIVTDGLTKHKKVTQCTVDEFWSSCMKLYSTVKQESKKETSIRCLEVTEYVIYAAEKSPLLSVLREMGSSPYLFLSNLGNTSAIPEPNIKEGPVKIELKEHFFSVRGADPVDFCPLCQFMHTFDNKFMWNVCYNPMRVSRRFVETYLENLEDVLKTYCN